MSDKTDQADKLSQLIDGSTIEGLRDVLGKSRRYTKNLKALDDLIESSILQIEEALRRADFGFTFTVTIGVETLSFQKTGKLVYFHHHLPTNAIDCDRDLRTRLLTDFIPCLIRHIGESLSARLPDRHDAIEIGKRIHDAFSDVYGKEKTKETT